MDPFYQLEPVSTLITYGIYILIHKCTMIYNGNEYAFILTLLNDMRLIMILKYDDDKDLKIFDYLFFY